MKRSAAILIALLLGVSAVLAAAPSQAAGAFCGITWGSLPKDRPVYSSGEVTGVRAGRHPCFDRLVIDISGDAGGYFSRYVSEVRMDGSGEVVPVRGGARLELVATAPVTPTDDWFHPGGELINTAGYQTFRQVAYAGSFEGQTTIGLGVRARLPFRVFLLDGPGSGSRMVVDVAHRW